MLTALEGLLDFQLSSITRLPRPTRRLLLAVLEHETLVDPAIETAIVGLRWALLQDVMSGPKVEGFGVDLIAALGVFSFNHEFI